MPYVAQIDGTASSIDRFVAKRGDLAIQTVVGKHAPTADALKHVDMAGSTNSLFITPAGTAGAQWQADGADYAAANNATPISVQVGPKWMTEKLILPIGLQIVMDGTGGYPDYMESEIDRVGASMGRTLDAGLLGDAGLLLTPTATSAWTGASPSALTATISGPTNGLFAGQAVTLVGLNTAATAPNVGLFLRSQVVRIVSVNPGVSFVVQADVLGANAPAGATAAAFIEGFPIASLKVFQRGSFPDVYVLSPGANAVASGLGITSLVTLAGSAGVYTLDSTACAQLGYIGSTFAESGTPVPTQDLLAIRSGQVAERCHKNPDFVVAGITASRILSMSAVTAGSVALVGATFSGIGGAQQANLSSNGDKFGGKISKFDGFMAAGMKVIQDANKSNGSIFLGNSDSLKLGVWFEAGVRKDHSGRAVQPVSTGMKDEVLLLGGYETLCRSRAEQGLVDGLARTA